MTKTAKKIIVKIGLKALDKTLLNVFIWLLFLSSVLTYFVIDRQKLALYVISFAINQFFLFIIFGSGVLALVNLYFFKKIPSIIDEILIKNSESFFTGEAPIFYVLQQWKSTLKQKPIGFNSIGKELLIRDFITSEITYIEYNLVYLVEIAISDLDDDRFASSEEICKRFKEVLLTNRLKFAERFSESFANRLTIDPTAKIPNGRKKDIMRVIPNIILQKYINSCSDFNIFLDNCITQISKEKLNRYQTLKALYSDLVKCIYAYKDNLLPNFREEFNGDLAQYHLLYDNCRLSPESKGNENASKKDYSI